ncbi:MAG: hypothetical protein JWO21_987, partial [Solirubrobacterales bacterium]|nr:hypothetical protein [Solirubrobacterales bacterium]
PTTSTVLLFGPTGVRRSTNAGAGFAPINATISIPRRHGKARKVKLSSFDLSRGAQVAGSAMFGLGKDVLESTNGGSGWTLVPRPLPKKPVSAIAFVNGTTGYEVSDGRMFFTRNRGRSWKEIVSVDVSNIGSMAQISFSSATNGYVLGQLQGNDNVLMRTENGGRTWTPELLGFPLGAVAAGGVADYAEGSEITGLFQTTNGGLSPIPSTLSLSVAGRHRLSRAKLRRAGNRVRLTGRLSPALEGEVVVISYATHGSWQSRNVVVSSRGTFSVTVPGIRDTTDFVAQWTGSDLVSGAGSPATRLTVTRR